MCFIAGCPGNWRFLKIKSKPRDGHVRASGNAFETCLIRRVYTAAVGRGLRGIIMLLPQLLREWVLRKSCGARSPAGRLFEPQKKTVILNRVPEIFLSCRSRVPEIYFSVVLVDSGSLFKRDGFSTTWRLIEQCPKIII